jgi:hypothetical protein
MATDRSDRDQKIIDFFTLQHLTHREIGKLVGLTGASVCKVLQRHNIPREAGTWVTLQCTHCHKTIQRARHAVKSTHRLFCSKTCYYASRANPNYHQWRHGQRKAREIVRQYFHLERHHVVHHWDGDNWNYTVQNLAVFASQSDHMEYHHGVFIPPLWDGRDIPTL